MTFIFFMSVAFVCLCALIYFFIKKTTEAYKIQLKKTNLLLRKSEETEVILREEIKSLQEKLNKIFKDPTTNLFGWDLFEDRLEQTLKESARYQLIMAVFLIDIDNFKMINQALGKEVGDALLREVAKRLQVCIRKVDTVSRFTEDIFAILLTQLAKKESAAIIAQRILQTMAEPFSLGEHELYITIGIGIALYPGDGEEGAVLLRNADYALHLAKENGKSHYQFYQKELYANSQRDLAVSTSFNRGSIFQEITLLYQPIVNCITNKIISMEMSLHWQQEDIKSIDEEEFFHLAKLQRKLSMLSEWIIEQATHIFLNWRQQGFNIEFISVPLSIYQLEDNHFIYQLSHTFQKYEFNPAHLLIEIRENISFVSLEVLEKSFNMLRYLGVKVAIDRFGLEAFPLASLKDLNIGYLKLDSSLIRDIHTNQKVTAIVRSIAMLAKNLSLQVIAQGVTAQAQATILKELGCILLQGEWIGAPTEEQAILAQTNK